MTYQNIEFMSPINALDENHVAEIAESIRENGFQGCPILILNDQLLTGSHRLAALNRLADEGFDVDGLGDIAEDVTDIVNESMAAYEEENGWCPDLAYDDIGWVLKGSWVEGYKDEIVEW